MSKRRPGFRHRERDDYPTPWQAVVPLLRLLKPGVKFVEPCCGDGQLAGHLQRAGHTCVGAYDLPVDARIARYVIEPDTIFITNSPWLRSVLHPIIVNLSDQLPTWLLIDCDWLCTSQATPYLPRLRAVVVIGRVRWIKHTGFDNCAWMLFDRPRSDAHAAIGFIGRVRNDEITPPSVLRAKS